MIWLPTLEHALMLHQKLVEASGGAHGVRDSRLIESAIAHAQASFAGTEAHEDIVNKAAA